MDDRSPPSAPKIKIDAQLLDDIGLSCLDVADQNSLLRAVYEELEFRVGQQLAGEMSDLQLDEFEVFVDSGDDTGAVEWLEAEFPDYRNVVHGETEKIVMELRQRASEICDKRAP